MLATTGFTIRWIDVLIGRLVMGAVVPGTGVIEVLTGVVTVFVAIVPLAARATRRAGTGCVVVVQSHDLQDELGGWFDVVPVGPCQLLARGVATTIFPAL